MKRKNTIEKKLKKLDIEFNQLNDISFDDLSAADKIAELEKLVKATDDRIHLMGKQIGKQIAIERQEKINQDQNLNK
jgi:predicted component of type VI protein secretion system